MSYCREWKLGENLMLRIVIAAEEKAEEKKTNKEKVTENIMRNRISFMELYIAEI